MSKPNDDIAAHAQTVDPSEMPEYARSIDWTQPGLSEPYPIEKPVAGDMANMQYYSAFTDPFTEGDQILGNAVITDFAERHQDSDPFQVKFTAEKMFEEMSVRSYTVEQSHHFAIKSQHPVFHELYDTYATDEPISLYEFGKIANELGIDFPHKTLDYTKSASDNQAAWEASKADIQTPEVAETPIIENVAQNESPTNDGLPAMNDTVTEQDGSKYDEGELDPNKKHRPAVVADAKDGLDIGVGTGIGIVRASFMALKNLIKSSFREENTQQSEKTLKEHLGQESEKVIKHAKNIGEAQRAINEESDPVKRAVLEDTILREGSDLEKRLKDIAENTTKLDNGKDKELIKALESDLSHANDSIDFEEEPTPAPSLEKSEANDKKENKVAPAVIEIKKELIDNNNQTIQSNLAKVSENIDRLETETDQQKRDALTNSIMQDGQTIADRIASTENNIEPDMGPDYINQQKQLAQEQQKQLAQVMEQAADMQAPSMEKPIDAPEPTPMSGGGEDGNGESEEDKQSKIKKMLEGIKKALDALMKAFSQLLGRGAAPSGPTP